MNQLSVQSDVMTTRLQDLERLLMDEHEALKKFDHEAVGRLSLEKLEVANQLGSLGKPREQHGPLLERIRERALMNQLLLVNARDCVRGIIELATGSMQAGYGAERPQQAPARLNIRG
jgi:hypothetical protein